MSSHLMWPRALVPFVVAAAVAASTWAALSARQTRAASRLRESLSASAESVQRDLSSRLSRGERAAAWLAARWEATSAPAAWQEQASVLGFDDDGVEVIAMRLTVGGKVEAVAPRTFESQLTGAEFGAEPRWRAAIAAALASGRPAMSEILTLVNGDPGVAIVAPIGSAAAPVGLLSRIIAIDQVAKRATTLVPDGRRVTVSVDPQKSAVSTASIGHRRFDVYGRAVEVSIYPADGELAGVGEPATALAWAFALALAAFAASVLGLRYRERERRRAGAERSRTAIAEASGERKQDQTLLDALPVAVLRVRADGVVVETNQRGRELLGPSLSVGASLSGVGGDDVVGFAAASHALDTEVCIADASSGQRWLHLSAPALGRGSPIASARLLVAVDITARSLADRRLRASLRQLNDAFELSPVPKVMVDTHGAFSRVNTAFIELLNVDSTLLLGAPALRYLAADDEPSTRALESLRAGSVEQVAFERVVRQPRTGRAIPVLVRASSVRSSDGGPSEIFAQFQDLTDIRRVEVELAERNRILAALIDHIPLSIICKNAKDDFRISVWNRASERLLGRRSADVLGRNVFELLPPEAASAVDRADRSVAQAGRPVQRPLDVFHSPLAGELLLETQIIPIVDERGETEVILQLSVDIRARVESERALRESESRFRLLIDAAPVMMWVTTERGRKTFLNRTWRTFVGRPDGDVAAGGMDDDIHPDDLAALYRLWSDRVMQEAPFAAEFRLRRADGVFRWVHSEGTPRYLEDGAFDGYIGCCLDITAHRDSERKLRAARDAAISASRTKSQFLANMSHEIRTPMNGILGITELLLDEDLPPSVRGHADLILTSANSLLTVINDILDFSKVEAGKIQLVREPVALRPMLDRVLALFGPRAAQKGLAFELTVADDAPQAFTGDEGKLVQILTNLVGNAVKFTAQGRVAVRASGGQSLKIAVEDTGIGISADFHDQIFESFTQADGAITRKFGGTGLGLAISRGLATAMGGDVSFRSQLGRGSVFTLDVPLILADSPREVAAPTPVARKMLAGLRVLLVEDNEVNQRLATMLLEKIGCRVVLAGNGLEALEILAAVAFDIILMDLQMPGLGGFEATQLLRAREADAGGRRTPVIALTAHALPDDKQRCLDSGMDGFVTKPFRGDELFAAMRSVLTPEALATPRASATDDAVPPETTGAPTGRMTDLAAIYARAGGDGRIVRQAAEIYLAHLDAKLAAIAAALAAEDAAKVAFAAHSLNGAAANFVGKQWLEPGYALERQACAGSLVGAPAFFAQLEQALRRSAVEIQELVGSKRSA